MVRGDKSRVDVAIFSTAVEREASNRQGYAQLGCSVSKPAQFFRRELGKQKQLGLYFASMGNADALAEHRCSVSPGIVTLMVSLSTTRQDLSSVATARWEALSQVFQLTLSSLEAVLKLRFEMVQELSKHNRRALLPALQICMLNWLSWCRKTCC